MTIVEPIAFVLTVIVVDVTGKDPGADYPSPGFAGGSGGGHGGLGGRAVSQVTTGGAYGSIREPREFGKMLISYVKLISA